MSETRQMVGCDERRERLQHAVQEFKDFLDQYESHENLDVDELFAIATSRDSLRVFAMQYEGLFTSYHGESPDLMETIGEEW